MTTIDVEQSLAHILAAGPQDVFDSFINDLTEAEAEALRYSWEFHGRKKQQMPSGVWTTWAIIAGRGFGKTRTGAEATRAIAEKGDIELMHLVAPTPADYRDVMIEGPAGLQAIAPKHLRPVWYPSKRLVEWPNGVKALAFSAEDPEALRGPQCGFAWADEPGAWTYGEETWDQLQFGLRLGQDPRQIMTTTPKPLKWLKAVLDDPLTHVTRGTTYENTANLAPTFLRAIVKKYEGTRLGRQELLAELLEAVEGALWTPELLEITRRTIMSETRPRLCVAVDPAATSKSTSDETGIVVVGQDEYEEVFAMEDCSPGRVSPNEWASAAIAAYYRHRADAIVAEVNNGGEMVESVIRNIDPDVPVEMVHATRGKAVRAEPIVSLFEQQGVSGPGKAHLLGVFPQLEEQLTGWVPSAKTTVSPDRLDAFVWGATWLTEGSRSRLIV